MNDEELEDLMYRAGLTAQGCWDSMDQYAREAIMDFAKLVAAAEREACAKVCDHMKNDIYNNSQEDTQPMAHAVANFCAEAIRARGET